MTIPLVIVAALTAAAAATASPQHARVLVRSTSLGKVLVDARGRTLYLFAADRAGKSACYARCAAAWPPYLTTAAPLAGPGVRQSLLRTTRRTDGRLQVVYAGHPLYVYSGDRAAGETGGEALGKKWYAVDPHGAKVLGAPAPAPPPTSTVPDPGGGGYGGGGY